MVQQVKNLTSIHEDADLISGLSQWLRIWHCHEPWCTSQMWLGSCVAMAMALAGSCSSKLTPSLGTSICCRCGPKKKKELKAWRGKPEVGKAGAQWNHLWGFAKPRDPPARQPGDPTVGRWQGWDLSPGVLTLQPKLWVTSQFRECR